MNVGRAELLRADRLTSVDAWSATNVSLLRAFAASAWGRSESAASPSYRAAGTGGKSVHLKEIRGTPEAYGSSPRRPLERTPFAPHCEPCCEAPAALWQAQRSFCWRSPKVHRPSHEKYRGRGEVTDSQHLVYIRCVRAALSGLIALASGAVVGFSTWNLELQSLPPGCQPCTGTVCSMAACVVQWPRLIAVATLLGLVATTLVFLAIRRFAR